MGYASPPENLRISVPATKPMMQGSSQAKPYANVENRLQMLIMNQTAEQETMEPAEAPERRTHRGNYRRPTLSST